MLILVSNVGSSSYKYQIIDIETEKMLTKGVVERIGNPPSTFTHSVPDKPDLEGEIDAPDHNAAVAHVIKLLLSQEHGVLKDLSELAGVGFKTIFAQGITRSALVTEDVIAALEEYIPVAPVHNPPYIASIRAFQKVLPGKPLVAVFETWFHESVPDYAYEYGVPREWVEKYNIRRYGFHGASHRYISQRTSQLLRIPAEELKIISCHLGGSSSLCAIKYGNSIDTSMGFSTQGGTLQSTRVGDLDPFAVLYVMDKEGLTADEVRTILTKNSGVLGISEVSGDMRDVEEAAAEENDNARLALDTFHYGVKKYIGAYVAALGGVDAIVFTGGIGEKGKRSREAICDGLEFMGIKLDAEKNAAHKGEGIISADDSRVKILVVPTNEELIVARETARVIEHGESNHI
ncbi:TPA: acetate kinase [Candidatus Poribacteria bacterium]|nr:acetate kinase [Candidatus Poribacteria bacterium]